MKITPVVFEAYLKCPTKCWLRSTGEPSTGNTYSEWAKAQNDSYRATATALLIAESPNDEVALSPDLHNPKAAKWWLAASVAVQAHMDSCDLESELHAVERVPAEGRGKLAQFIPIRFVFTNKLGKDDKLLLAFDAFALSKSLGREISLGKIIHGDDRATLKVKTAALASEVRKRVEKIIALLANTSPPDLVLNRHCAECEFQARCRQKAVEKDDLSLLSNMNAKERKEFHSKGIFTVTQLSYTFRPRRRPKKLRDKRERYHHSLMWDINGDLLKNPFDHDLKDLAGRFGRLLRDVIQTVDRFGLKARFLRKHKKEVVQFYTAIELRQMASIVAQHYRERFLKCREKLFVFLDHDGVPWNNNNAEHAIKPIAKYRPMVKRAMQRKGVESYLVLLSIYQTCQYQGLSFLEFLRSGEKDINAFAESRRACRRGTQASRPTDLPVNAIPVLP